MLTIADDWRAAYPRAVVGALALDQVTHPDRHEGLEHAKVALETELREQYGSLDRVALRNLPVLRAYDAFYRAFRKTYHVQLQLESVALKGKSLPSVAALVECMFMAELRDQMLTSGHDLDLVQPPVMVHAAAGGELLEQMNGETQELKAGDMYIADAQGILSSVIYGPDQRTRITEGTRRALFTTYAPEGIGPTAVQRHLEQILAYARIVSPGLIVEALEVHQA